VDSMVATQSYSPNFRSTAGSAIEDSHDTCRPALLSSPDDGVVPRLGPPAAEGPNGAISLTRSDGIPRVDGSSTNQSPASSVALCQGRDTGRCCTDDVCEEAPCAATSLKGSPELLNKESLPQPGCLADRLLGSDDDEETQIYGEQAPRQVRSTPIAIEPAVDQENKDTHSVGCQDVLEDYSETQCYGDVPFDTTANLVVVQTTLATGILRKSRKRCQGRASTRHSGTSGSGDGHRSSSQGRVDDPPHTPMSRRGRRRTSCGSTGGPSRASSASCSTERYGSASPRTTNASGDRNRCSPQRHSSISPTQPLNERRCPQQLSPTQPLISHADTPDTSRHQHQKRQSSASAPSHNVHEVSAQQHPEATDGDALQRLCGTPTATEVSCQSNVRLSRKSREKTRERRCSLDLASTQLYHADDDANSDVDGVGNDVIGHESFDGMDVVNKKSSAVACPDSSRQDINRFAQVSAKHVEPRSDIQKRARLMSCKQEIPLDLGELPQTGTVYVLSGREPTAQPSKGHRKPQRLPGAVQPMQNIIQRVGSRVDTVGHEHVEGSQYGLACDALWGSERRPTGQNLCSPHPNHRKLLAAKSEWNDRVIPAKNEGWMFDQRLARAENSYIHGPHASTDANFSASSLDMALPVPATPPEAPWDLRDIPMTSEHGCRRVQEVDKELELQRQQQESSTHPKVNDLGISEELHAKHPPKSLVGNRHAPTGSSRCEGNGREATRAWIQSVAQCNPSHATLDATWINASAGFTGISGIEQRSEMSSEDALRVAMAEHGQSSYPGSSNVPRLKSLQQYSPPQGATSEASCVEQRVTSDRNTASWASSMPSQFSSAALPAPLSEISVREAPRLVQANNVGRDLRGEAELAAWSLFKTHGDEHTRQGSIDNEFAQPPAKLNGPSHKSFEASHALQRDGGDCGSPICDDVGMEPSSCNGRVRMMKAMEVEFDKDESAGRKDEWFMGLDLHPSAVSSNMLSKTLRTPISSIDTFDAQAASACQKTQLQLSGLDSRSTGHISEKHRSDEHPHWLRGLEPGCSASMTTATDGIDARVSRAAINQPTSTEAFKVDTHEEVSSPSLASSVDSQESSFSPRAATGPNLSGGITMAGQRSIRRSGVDEDFNPCLRAAEQSSAPEVREATLFSAQAPTAAFGGMHDEIDAAPSPRLFGSALAREHGLDSPTTRSRRDMCFSMSNAITTDLPRIDGRTASRWTDTAPINLQSTSLVPFSHGANLRQQEQNGDDSVSSAAGDFPSNTTGAFGGISSDEMVCHSDHDNKFPPKTVVRHDLEDSRSEGVFQDDIFFKSMPQHVTEIDQVAFEYKESLDLPTTRSSDPQTMAAMSTCASEVVSELPQASLKVRGAFQGKQSAGVERLSVASSTFAPDVLSPSVNYGNQSFSSQQNRVSCGSSIRPDVNSPAGVKLEPSQGNAAGRTRQSAQRKVTRHCASVDGLSRVEAPDNEGVTSQTRHSLSESTSQHSSEVQGRSTLEFGQRNEASARQQSSRRSDLRPCGGVERLSSGSNATVPGVMTPCEPLDDEHVALQMNRRSRGKSSQHMADLLKGVKRELSQAALVANSPAMASVVPRKHGRLSVASVPRSVALGGASTPGRTDARTCDSRSCRDNTSPGSDNALHIVEESQMHEVDKSNAEATRIETANLEQQRSMFQPDGSVPTISLSAKCPSFSSQARSCKTVETNAGDSAGVAQTGSSARPRSKSVGSRWQAPLPASLGGPAAFACVPWTPQAPQSWITEVGSETPRVGAGEVISNADSTCGENDTPGSAARSKTRGLKLPGQSLYPLPKAKKQCVKEEKEEEEKQHSEQLRFAIIKNERREAPKADSHTHSHVANSRVPEEDSMLPETQRQDRQSNFCAAVEASHASALVSIAELAPEPGENTKRPFDDSRGESSIPGLGAQLVAIAPAPKRRRTGKWKPGSLQVVVKTADDEDESCVDAGVGVLNANPPMPLLDLIPTLPSGQLSKRQSLSMRSTQILKSEIPQAVSRTALGSSTAASFAAGTNVGNQVKLEQELRATLALPAKRTSGTSVRTASESASECGDGIADEAHGQTSAAAGSAIVAHGASPVFATSGLELSLRQRRILIDLGVAMVDEWTPSITHIIADTFRRTTKIMCGICRGVRIITPDYIHACRVAGKLVDEERFLLHDVVCETAFARRRGLTSGYSLTKALNRARGNGQLLQGVSVYCFPSVVEKRELPALVAAAGGKWLHRFPSSPDDGAVLLLAERAVSSEREQRRRKAHDVYDVELLREAACTQVLRRGAYRLR